MILVPQLEVSPENPITQPLEVVVLDNETGAALTPTISATSDTSGRVVLSDIPASVTPALHIVGSGDGDSDFYDTIHLNLDRDARESFLGVGSVGLAQIEAITASFVAQPDRAALSGTVVWQPPGEDPQDALGCAQLFLDDSESPLDADSDQRYVGDNGLPTLPEEQQQTLTSGHFYFGNLSTGAHILRVSTDGGATFIGETSFVLPRARQEALGPAPQILYKLVLPITTPTFPEDGC